MCLTLLVIFCYTPTFREADKNIAKHKIMINYFTKFIKRIKTYMKIKLQYNSTNTQNFSPYYGANKIVKSAEGNA